MLHLAFIFCLLGSEVPLEELANLIIDPSSSRRMDKVINYMSPFLFSLCHKTHNFSKSLFVD